MPPVFNLYGDIGFEVSARGVDDFINANIEEPELHFRLFSHGGDVFEGFAIMAALSRFPGKKVGFVDGLAASMASAIMCVCDEVKASEDAFIMIHNPYFFMLDGGDAEELRRQADFLEKVQTTVSAAYQRKSGMSEADVTAVMAEETWYTAQEALDAGFVDEIIAPAKMAAKLKNDRLSKFKHPPKGLVRDAADAKMRANLSGGGSDDGTPKPNKGKKMKLSIKDLQAKYPGMSLVAIKDIIRSVRAAEGESEELPGQQGPCEDAGYFWYEDACHKEPKPATAPTDTALAALPTEEGACKDAGYYWYEDSCHEEPQAQAATDGGVPTSPADCEDAGMYWYEDACHESPQAQAAEGGGGDKTTTITTTVTTAQAKKMEDRIKAAEKHLKSLSMSAAKQIAARVFAGCDLSEETQHDLFHAVIPHCKFVKDGMLDDEAYETKLREKVEAYGGRIVDGPGYHLDGPPMNTPKGKANGYDKEYIKELRSGK